MKIAGLEEAKQILGADVIGPAEVAAALGFDPLATLSEEDKRRVLQIPFHRELLVGAAHDGQMLVFRLALGDRGIPLTILSLAERLERSSDNRLEKSPVEAWFAREPFARRDTCRPGWALVAKQPLTETRNLPYAEQTEALRARAERQGVSLRRRTAVEIVYDTLLFEAARRERLLETDWDWSSSPTIDGGWVTVGEFGSGGLKLVGYSKAVRFGTLGICANLDGLHPTQPAGTNGV